MPTLIAFAALLVGAAGLISIIVPLRFLGINSRFKAFGLVILSLVGLGYAGSQMESSPPSATLPATAVAASAAQETPLPPEQARFVQIVEDARSKYRSEQGDFRKGATRPERSRLLCNTKTGTVITDWVGTIATLTTNGDGKGVVAVQISAHVTLTTWNNAVSDIGDKTLVEPTSPVFRQLGELRRDDRVKVSGRLISSDTDCYREGSTTMSGSMTDPEYLMQFRKIEKL